MSLYNRVKSLQKTKLKDRIKNRLSEFELYRKKSGEDWFSELCFCILTANSKAKTGLAIQKELGSHGFISLTQAKITDCIKRNKHRFHNNKAKFIVEARKHTDIKDKIQNIIGNRTSNASDKNNENYNNDTSNKNDKSNKNDENNKNVNIVKEEFEAREWLVKNIKGLGYKEASHFLRNVGYKNLAILDRHILNLLIEDNLISEKPKALNKNKYLEIEKTLLQLANKLNMSQAELDMYLWYMKAGDVLK